MYDIFEAPFKIWIHRQIENAAEVVKHAIEAEASVKPTSSTVAKIAPESLEDSKKVK